MTDPTRRRVLQWMGATGTAGALLPGCGIPERSTPPTSAWPGAGDVDGDVFPMAVAAGDPLPDGAICWTRTTADGPLRLVWSTWRGDAWSDPEEVSASSADGGFVHVDLRDLPPDTWVAYQFLTEDGAGSAVGRFVTPPDDRTPGLVRLGFTSCTHQEHESFPSMTAVLDRGPLDAFVFLGDTAYFDSVPTDADAFRSLYATNLTAPGFAEVRASTACVFTFDDHEFENDFSLETIAADRLRLAMDAWQETLPFRPDPDHPDRIWRSLRFGATVEVLVVDVRSEREPSKDLFIAPEQLDWIVDRLRSSTATWKVIATPVPFADYTGTPWDLPPLTSDKWSGFARQRQQIVDAIADHAIEGVLFVGGDVHCTYLGRIQGDGGAQNTWEVLAGPGGSFLNPTSALLPDGERFLWADDVWNSVRLTFDPAGTVTIEVVGEADETHLLAVVDAAGDVLQFEPLDPTATQAVFG